MTRTEALAVARTITLSPDRPRDGTSSHAETEWLTERFAAGLLEAAEGENRACVALAQAMATGIEERKGSDIMDRVIYGAGSSVALAIASAIASRRSPE